jgi:SAM-dependent methyltransferase
LYSGAIARGGLPLAAARNVLEIGSGATNSVGYALAHRQIAGSTGRIYLFEPHAELDCRADAILRRRYASADLSRVERVTTLDALPDRSIDLVLSHSVLEHVTDMHALLASIDRVLGPAGRMIHSVDYRDHFFKYPYHFLAFRKAVWDRWLDPGDLPRWRLSGHIEAFSAHGFCTEVQDSHCLPDAFDRIRHAISQDFDRDDPALAVATAIILNTRQGDASCLQHDSRTRATNDSAPRS